jgi:hypothetical protein
VEARECETGGSHLQGVTTVIAEKRGAYSNTYWFVDRECLIRISSVGHDETIGKCKLAVAGLFQFRKKSVRHR